MKKTITCLLSGALLTLGSCQSDEPTPRGGEQTNNGTAVKFTYDSDRTASPSLRTYYDTDGSVNWSAGDQVNIVSPAGSSASSEQSAMYSTGTGGNRTSAFDLVDSNDFIAWNESETTQNFYAYYPGNRLGIDPAQGAITDIDPATGSALFSVPADQSATHNIRPKAAADTPTNPLAYAIAITRGVATAEQPIVQLDFNDFMNVLRIRVDNSVGSLISGVKVSSSDAAVSGAVRVQPSASQSEGVVSDFTYTIQGASSTPAPSTAIIANHLPKTGFEPDDENGGTGNLYYDIYLLPQTYAAGTLTITLIVGEDDAKGDETDDISRVIKSDFTQSSIKRIRINMPDIPVYGIEMIDIPAGTFELGGTTTTNNVPVSTHPMVKLSGFRMSKTEITQGQWAAVITDGIHALQNNTGAAAALRNAGFSMSDDDKLQLNGDTTGIKTTDVWPGNNPSSSTGMSPNHPAYNVSYNDVANIFIPMLNILTGRTYKLPTEAQWEYAARGGSATNDYAGATGGFLNIRTVGWCYNSRYNTAPASPADGERRTQAVGQLPKNGNGYGLHDMTGNVREWCRDYSTPNYPNPAPDDYVFDTYTYYRVCRGGGYDVADYDTYFVSYRDRDEPTARKSNLGFRLAM